MSKESQEKIDDLVNEIQRKLPEIEEELRRRLPETQEMIRKLQEAGVVSRKTMDLVVDI